MCVCVGGGVKRAHVFHFSDPESHQLRLVSAYRGLKDGWKEDLGHPSDPLAHVPLLLDQRDRGEASNAERHFGFSVVSAEANSCQLPLRHLCLPDKRK